MNYVSTRDSQFAVSAAQAIVDGIAPDGGLYVPEGLPSIDGAFLQRLLSMNYNERATEVLSLFLTDFKRHEIMDCTVLAYASGQFDASAVAPVVSAGEGLNILELWHGPTCAFKDMALQILPHLMTYSAEKVGEKREIAILVATSGDTGKAALQGFMDVQGTRIVVFYPEDGVSHMQKRMMITQEGGNVYVCGIKGNFDDAQSGVKRIFSDHDFAGELSEKGVVLSSANSINWGRLVPQIVYYISAYCDMVGTGQVKMGDNIHFAVPTGNFGNILAGWYAKCMGLPIGRLICASNKNNVLTDFIRTGVYDRNRPFYTTTSPSMDILVSSNLERLIAMLVMDDEKTSQLMQSLRETGKYQIEGTPLARLQENFYGGYLDDEAGGKLIERVFEETGYLLDPHTAVAVGVRERYIRETGDDTSVVVVSTANPFKFAPSVLDAFDEAAEGDQEQRLMEISHWQVPKQIERAKTLPIRFPDVCTADQMYEAVRKGLRK